MIILAFDPGNTVGLATYSPYKFSSFQLAADDALPFIRGWASELGAFNDAWIVGERFMIGSDTHKKTAQPDAVRVFNGAMEIADGVGLQTAWYSASLSKTYTDAYLRGIHGFARGKRHANDATRILLTHLLDKYPHELNEIVKRGALHVSEDTE